MQKWIQITSFKILGTFTLLSFSLLINCSRSSDLEWTDENDYRWAEINPGFFGTTGFTRLSSAQTNIDFENVITEEEIKKNRHYLIGSGVAAGDIDGDGLTDLYFAGLKSSNKLYKNVGGMKFEDITDQSGVAHNGYFSTGAVFADINGNGHLDLLVTSMHRQNTLYINDGTGNFTKKEDSGLGEARGSTTIALADLTGNGYPDLYITNYKERSVKDIFTTEELELENVVKEPMIDPTDDYTLVPPFDQHYKIHREDGNFLGLNEIGETDELYYNTGGTFEKVNDTRNVFLNKKKEPYGLQPDWGLTAKFQDLNDDGLIDLYVCNDFETPDRIWLNMGNGTFQEISWKAIRNFSFSCMSVDFSDINRNGSLDIMAVEMLSPFHHRRLSQAGSDDPKIIRIGDSKTRPMYNRNSLYLKREDHTYAEISHYAGIEATGWSWATRFMDVNLNGYEDVVISTGYSYDILDIDAQIEMVRARRNMDEHYVEFLQKTDPLHLQNRILRNNGDLTFTDVSSEWGMSDEDVSHGMAFADLNNDGVLDIVMNRMNQNAAVYQNKTSEPRIAVRLKGRPPNTQAIGAKVELHGGPTDQMKQISAGGDYASGSDPLVMFAADPDSRQDHRILITWPDGLQTKIDSVKANRIYEIDQALAPETEPATGRMKSSSPLFEDITDQLDHQHHEDPFNDFGLQPLLPARLSQSGPAVSWIDINQDGIDDLLIGSGKGGELSVFETSEDFTFSQSTIKPLTNIARGDQTTILGWGENNKTKIIVGNSNYEQGTSHAPSAYIFTIEPEDDNLSSNFPLETAIVNSDSIPGIHSSTGPIAAADVNGNGFVDLFIGGSFKPGRYPEDADSRLFINNNGAYVQDNINTQVFSDLGLVTGALFSDFTQNGWQDLLLSTEWGTLRLFENIQGKFREITKKAGLDRYSGWWNGVAVGDFTNNGLPDIIATNIGLNSPWQLRHGYPIKMYYDDLNSNGMVDIFEAYADKDGNYLPKHRLYRFQQNQIILNRMNSHVEFANSTLSEIFGERLSRIPYKEINTLEHMVFINTGAGFEAHSLPVEAQLSMAFNPATADFNNDGNEDIFISQNFFAVPKEVPRMDAGRGLILQGKGDGTFVTLNGTGSGIKIYGEQRGAAVSDFNKNGKVDLAVSQNGAGTRLFLNRTNNQGFRITLKGPSGNQNGIGSMIQLVYQNGNKGPARYIQSGSGHWSQNGFTQIMGTDEADVQAINVLWFDNVNQTVTVTINQKKYTITHPEVEL